DPAGWIWDGGGPSALIRRHVDPGGAAQSREAYVARLYAAFCEAASRLDPGRGALVDYAALPAAVWQSVAPHFGLAVDAGLRARMQAGAAMNAKAPVGRPQPFAGDGAAKQAAAGEALRRAVDEHALPALERLRARHAAASG
ncbi:MAG TPA: hypothetical protein VFU77_03455, partial [Steroidobacteraceae bacterium]|nr:hypothetical protein [Steroidobacteraceae bacterium]